MVGEGGEGYKNPTERIAKSSKIRLYYSFRSRALSRTASLLVERLLGCECSIERLDQAACHL